MPEDVSYRTRPEQGLDMLDMWGTQVLHSWVGGDDELGRHTRFRSDLRERGERYVLGVPCTTTIRDLEVRSCTSSLRLIRQPDTPGNPRL